MPDDVEVEVVAEVRDYYSVSRGEVAGEEIQPQPQGEIADQAAAGAWVGNVVVVAAAYDNQAHTHCLQHLQEEGVAVVDCKEDDDIRAAVAVAEDVK